MVAMNIKLIKTEADHAHALSRSEEIFDAPQGLAEGDELEMLGMLIEKQEDTQYPIGPGDPIEAITYRMC
jgi:HTH-type transcriptional regulator/antitoxin HigA